MQKTLPGEGRGHHSSGWNWAPAKEANSRRGALPSSLSARQRQALCAHGGQGLGGSRGTLGPSQPANALSGALCLWTPQGAWWARLPLRPSHPLRSEPQFLLPELQRLLAGQSESP